MNKQLLKLIEEMDLRFKSSNAILVERAAIRLTEWQEIKKALQNEHDSNERNSV